MRVLNFNAGPSCIPLEVLEYAKSEFTDFKGCGSSVMELSHRSKIFENILNSATKNLKELYSINDDFVVLFLQGGASLQFVQIPMNLYNGGVAQYVDTGTWTSKAIKEAQILGINYEVIATSEDFKFNYIPKFSFSDNADYGYICSNNTIHGTQYKELPNTKCPLVVDSSSDFLSREIDFKNIGLFYAGAQKNAGPAGLTIVIIRKDLANRVKSNVPTMLSYKTHIENNSLYNTPNTFGIYMFDLVTKWIKKQGGLKKINEYNLKKADLLYKFLDENIDFYIPFAKKDSRSLMNVTFNLKNEELEKRFVEFSQKENMIGLKGHRSLGGIRASIYNAVSLEDVKALVSFMDEFARKNG